MVTSIKVERSVNGVRIVSGYTSLTGSRSVQHLSKLLPPHIQDPAPSTYLYLAQTAPTPQEALQLYESAIQLLQAKVNALQDGMNEEGETKEELMKECITAFVAMIEIWMSDLW